MSKANARKGTRVSPKARASNAAGGKPRQRKRRSMEEINAWMSAHHEQLLEAARKNCIRLTGRPTFGGSRRRQSA